MQKTNKVHTFLNNVFNLDYPRHVLNKQLFTIRSSSVQAADSIALCILRGV
jgi:hypothetical protein